MLMFGRKRWAAAAAWAGMCVATIGHAGEQQTSRMPIRTAILVNDDLPSAPMPDSVDTDAPPPREVNPPAPPPPIPAEAIPPPADKTSTQQMPMPPSATNGSAPRPAAVHWAMLPPPGTLGQTYRRRSALVDDEEHPRHAVVIVKLPEHADVAARGLKVKWTGEEWRLETALPLVPGMPHIYAVQAEWDTPTGRVAETRWVRLIMGRVVDLEF